MQIPNISKERLQLIKEALELGLATTKVVQIFQKTKMIFSLKLTWIY